MTADDVAKLQIIIRVVNRADNLTLYFKSETGTRHIITGFTADRVTFSGFTSMPFERLDRRQFILADTNTGEQMTAFPL